MLFCYKTKNILRKTERKLCEFVLISIIVNSFNTSLESNNINIKLKFYLEELMNKYLKLASLLETVVKNDYSGCLDKKEIIDDHQLKLKENLTRNDFYEAASAYLRLFKDRHL